MRRQTLGLFRIQAWSIGLGPLTLLEFSAPHCQGHRCWWEIRGGLLAARPGGRLSVGWDQGQLWSSVTGYHPRLPAAAYRLTQLPVHVGLTRLMLLDVRGRRPPPGLPASPSARLAAAAIDLALCGAAGGWLGRRGRPWLGIGLAAAYHVGFWRLGATPGGWLLGLRVLAVDGARPTVAQAVVRLLAAPMAWARRMAIHDQIAQTEVVRRPGS
jgi:hypothetical protein